MCSKKFVLEVLPKKLCSTEAGINVFSLSYVRKCVLNILLGGGSINMCYSTEKNKK